MTHQLSLEHSACYQKVLAVWFQAVSAKTNSSWTQNMNCSKNQVLLHGKWWEEARRMNMNTGAFAALSSQIWQIISTPLKMTTALRQVIPHFPSVTSLLKRTTHTVMWACMRARLRAKHCCLSEQDPAEKERWIQRLSNLLVRGKMQRKLALLCVHGRQCQTASGEWQACRKFNIMLCHAGEKQWQEQPSRWTLQSQSYYPIATWGFLWLRWWECLSSSHLYSNGIPDCNCIPVL